MYSSKNLTTIAVALIAFAAPLAAQDPQCAMPDPNATAACNTAVDAIRAFHPLAGMIVSGGNPVLGTSGSLGGIGHLTITARVNAIKASLPNPDSASQSRVPSSFNGAIPAPLVEAALGLVRGRGGFLSVDALGSAVVLPTGGVSGLAVDSNAAHIGGAALGIGYGARVGILAGTFPIPALSVSWMRRTLPRIQYGILGPAFGTGDQFEFSMDLKADSYRAVASWKFVLVDLAAGLGIDHYSSSQTAVRFHDDPLNPAHVRTVVINPANTREVVFADAGLSLAVIKLVGEVGFQTGKDQSFATTFSNFDPKAGHVFGGVGLRFGF
ncbi:MAG: hypothetical protein DMD52_05200 [Gemmatimonadetes bacterium]|nr:MAG: hypothetical protein DMD52_05200 [Gemmatimonadota bacterium]